ncbi:TIGR02678 family protein [Abyssisolibacter fermentans]|uniref:TIGR02678 family protein n=1 Tax=Abyssisolibacter fermentans TaxID=1766203 RepID=UPI0008300B22|nr:TIGR02678 family protein [Abyssisolibacter fermentans]
MNSLGILLNEYWILKSKDRNKYYQLKDDIYKYKNFYKNKLGYNLIVTQDVIKLEKLPADPHKWMGIESFETPLDYILLLIVLMFLEDKVNEEQFLLSEVTDYITLHSPNQQSLDWTIYQNRRSFVRVIKFMNKMGMIDTNDGSSEEFYSSYEAEALYENTGVSKYFMRHFFGNIQNYKSIKDFRNDEWIDRQEDLTVVKRNNVYRKLLISPGFYWKSNDSEYLYLKNYRHIIEDDFDKYVNGELHFHRKGCYLVMNEDCNYKGTFPENKNISDIVLLFASELLEQISTGDINVDLDDNIVLNEYEFTQQIERIKDKYSKGWGKSYKEMKIENLVDEILVYMERFEIAQRFEDNIKIYPIIGKITGRYPKSFEL